MICPYCREDVPSLISIEPADGEPGCLRCARLFLRDWDTKRHRPTYISWASMLHRCQCPGAGNYKYYGGRDITVCDRWQIYENFLADMGERPKGMTLDRIDPDGNYEPGNCRWATQKDQMRNRRKKTLALDSEKHSS